MTIIATCLFNVMYTSYKINNLGLGESLTMAKKKAKKKTAKKKTAKKKTAKKK